MRRVAYGVIAVQCLAILLLGTYLWHNFGDSTAPLRKEDYQFMTGGTLSYFYEPVPDSNAVHAEPTWLIELPEYPINSDTLRDTTNHALSPHPGVFRLAMLGDSFTYGLFVHTDDTYSEVLEEILNERRTCDDVRQYEVLNLGVPGYDLRYAAERFLLRGVKYDPDAVVWLVKVDDYEEVREYVLSNRDPLYGDRLSVTQQLSIRHRAFAELGVTAVTAYQSDAFSIVRSAYDGPLVRYARWPVLYDMNVVDFFWRWHPTSEFPSDTLHVKKVVELFSHTLRFYTSRIRHYLSDFYAYDAEKVYTYTSDMVLSTAQDQYPDGHPNVSGHQKIAEDIYGYLDASGLLPCPPRDATANDPITSPSSTPLATSASA